MPGKFQGRRGQKHCFQCEKGKFSPALFSETCEICPVGKHQNVEGSSMCFVCMPGFTAPSRGLHVCTDCSPGFFMNESQAKTECHSCNIGYFEDQHGSYNCKPCRVGTFQNKLAKIDCESCPSGYFQSFPGKSTCESCPSGFFQKEIAQTSCLMCLAGKYMPNRESMTDCLLCPSGYVAPSSKQTACLMCVAGKSSTKEGQTYCNACSPGKFQPNSGSTIECLDCPTGQYRDEKENAIACLVCPVGKIQPVKGRASCLPCIPGRYNNKVNQSICVECPINYFAPEIQLTSCTNCLPGTFTNGRKASASCQPCPAGTAGSGCALCDPGMYRGNTDDAKICFKCRAGLHASDAGSPFCLDCDAGKYANKKGLIICVECQSGRYQDEKRAKTTCKFCQDATEVPNKLKGATGCEPVQIDPNAAIPKLNSILPISSDGKSLQLKYSFTKSEVSSSDRLFEKGDVLEIVVSTRTDFKISYPPKIVNLPISIAGDHEPLELSFQIHSTGKKTIIASDGITELSGLGSAWAQLRYFRARVKKLNGGYGPFATRNDAWIVSNKCSDKMFLVTHPNNDLSKKPLALVSVVGSGKSGGEHNKEKNSVSLVPSCAACPEGANCRGARTFAQIIARQGYHSLPWDNRKYGECPRSIACPGNDMALELPQEDFYLDGGNSSKIDTPCSPGHQGLFCGECKPYFDTKLGDVKGLCRVCPNEKENIIRIGILTVSVMSVLAFLVHDSLAGIDEISASVAMGEDAAVPFHSVGIRIMSSFMQVAGLLNNFRLNLPNAIAQLMTILQTTSGVGGAVISFNCLLPATRGVALFMTKLITTIIILPCLLAILVVTFWMFHSCFCQKKLKNGPGSMDKMIGSMLVLYYLTFPSMLHGMTQAMSCTTYGPRNDDATKVLLDGALIVECYNNEHFGMLATVVLPSFLIFVIIIPALVIYSMRREYMKHRLLPHQNHFNPVSCYRYGFLFLGYEQEFYGFELSVMLRKAAFVVTSGLLRPHGPTAQVVGATCILFFALSIHLQYRPYDSDGHDIMESFSLHTSLAILLSVLLCSKVGADADGQLGPISSTVLIIFVFASVSSFFWVSFSHITKHSHNHKGVLGVISRCLTKKSHNDRRHSVSHGEKQPVHVRRGSTMNVRNNKATKIAPKRFSRRLTVHMVNKAVTDQKVANFEKAHDEQHAKTLQSIRIKKKIASSRLQQRLIARRNTNNSVKNSNEI